MKKLIRVFDEKHKDEFHLLNRTYKNFEEFLLKNGKLISKDTGLGYWSAAPMNEAFEVFKTLFDESKATAPVSRRFSACRSFCDLGSGDGRIVLLASLFLIKKAVGVECDPWLHNISLHMKNHIGLDEFCRSKFLLKDFSHHCIRGYDYVFISPDRPFYRGLEDKMKKELDGKLIVHSNIFQPSSLNKLEEFNINGERFCVYER